MRQYRKKRILIVEDNPLDRNILKDMLTEKYLILEAENGRQGLEILETNKNSIDLILLDVLMPAMDGYTFLDKVKGNSEYVSIPVIVMTQEGGEQEQIKALSHGAADFLPKPYRAQFVLHIIENVLVLREAAILANEYRYDPLTGLFSRGYFYKQARETLDLHGDAEYDVICFNIENFKLYNEVFGRKAGDQLLCEIADYFNRRVYTAGNSIVLCRYHADRFMMLRERTTEITPELIQEVNQQISQLSSARNLIIKIGIYPVSDPTMDVEQMCDRAILAAESIQGQYFNSYCFYNDEIRRKLMKEQMIINEMESALEQGQFDVYFQPKYSLDDDSLVSAEALIRWNHPKKGLISPADFIPLFEKNGFIARMDRFVWEKTCQKLQEWKKKGYPEISVSVNVSRADFYYNDIAEILSGLVKKYEILPRQLHLEITETAYSKNQEQMAEILNKLIKMGFVIELDDFGSGYSSLNALSQMSLNVLKLDVKFVQTETAKSSKDSILKFVIDLAHWRDISVVAEGVESKEQLEQLKETGCDFAQGYYLARPMPADDFEKLLIEK